MTTRFSPSPQLLAYGAGGLERDDGRAQLLLTRGARVLHRGVSRGDAGRRVLLAFTYDPPGKRANRLRDA